MRNAILVIVCVLSLSLCACSSTPAPPPTIVLPQPTPSSIAPATPSEVVAAKAKSEAAILDLAKRQGLDQVRVVTQWNQKTGLELRVFSILQSTTDESQVWYAAHDRNVTISDLDTPSLAQAPNIPGLTRALTQNTQGEFVFVYKNETGMEVAELNPLDKYHNRQLAWNWKQILASSDKALALRELFDPITFAGGLDSPENKTWIESALIQWSPQVSELSLPNSQTIRAHYPDSQPPAPETMFEALSRIKIISASDTDTSYGGINGEIRLSRAARYDYPAAYQRVATSEEMHLFTFAIIVKEAQVIAWAQDHNLRGCSPTDVDNPTEYYSTTWLVMILSSLAPKLQGDQSYVVKTMIPFYENVLSANQFPLCSP